MKFEVGQRYRIKEITDPEILRGRFVPTLKILPVGTEVTITRLSSYNNRNNRVHTVSTKNHKAVSCHEARLMPITPEDLYVDTDF